MSTPLSFLLFLLIGITLGDLDRATRDHEAWVNQEYSDQNINLLMPDVMTHNRNTNDLFGDEEPKQKFRESSAKGEETAESMSPYGKKGSNGTFPGNHSILNGYSGRISIERPVPVEKQPVFVVPKPQPTHPETVALAKPVKRSPLSIPGINFGTGEGKGEENMSIGTNPASSALRVLVVAAAFMIWDD